MYPALRTISVLIEMVETTSELRKRGSKESGIEGCVDRGVRGTVRGLV